MILTNEQQAVIHRIAKRYLTRRDQGRFMGEVRTAAFPDAATTPLKSDSPVVGEGAEPCPHCG